MPEWRIGYSSIKILFSSVCPFKSWRGCVVFIWYSTGWRRPTRGLRTSWGMPRAPGSSTRGCPSRRRAETEIRRVQMSKLLYKFCRMITKERDEGIGRVYAHFFYAFFPQWCCNQSRLLQENSSVCMTPDKSVLSSTPLMGPPQSVNKARANSR